MPVKKNIILAIAIFICCILLLITLPYLVKKLGMFKSKADTASLPTVKKGSGKRSNTHFNLKKLQNIMVNENLTRRQKAQMVNNLGFQLLKKNRFGEAIDYFEFALEYDNTFISAHHNLACALLKEDPECRSYQAFRAILFELRLDPTRKDFISSDSDIAPLRSTNAYSILQNGFPQNDSLLKLMLVGRWYKINKRTSQPDIHFGSNTQGFFSVISKEGLSEKIEFTYYVSDRIITIMYSESGKPAKKLLLIDYDMDRMIILREKDGFDCWSEFNSCEN